MLSPVFEFEILYIVGYDRSRNEVIDTFTTYSHSEAEAIQDFIWSQHADESIIVGIYNRGMELL